jgi:hypothetical protein
VNLNGSGKARVLYYAIDNAGNSAPPDISEVKYDTIAPTVSHTLYPDANAAGWNNAATTAAFTAQDDSDGSGVNTLSIDGAVVSSQASKTSLALSGSTSVTAETSGQPVAASAEDFAGNVGTDSVTVRLDRTAPTIGGAATTGPSATGWYTGPVTVHFSCADQGAVQSGIATCPADVVLSSDGANQSVAGAAVDRAGNTARTTIGGISIDSVRPTISSLSVANGAIYTLGDPAAPSGSPACTASDGGSGVASCSVAIAGGQPNGVGTFSFTATAADRAGNTTTQTGTYRVVYRFDGFLQPINDTAHQVAQGVSVFKGGSTVPAKLQLKRADGTVVQAASAPRWLTPAKGSPTAATVDESVYADPATSGDAYRWDSTAQQYVYNWGTKGSAVGYYYRVGVALDDGQIYYVSVGLR